MKTRSICTGIGAIVLAGSWLTTAPGAAVQYANEGSAYTENFDMLSSAAAPSGGYGWQQGAATSNNTAYNGPTGTAGIAGVYVYTSNVVGATASMQDNPTGPRNFIGPDGTTPSDWLSASSYYAGQALTSGSRLISLGSSATVNPDGARDRALGVIAGSTAHTATNGLWPGDAYTAMVLQNTTGHTLENFTVSYYAEKWVDNLATNFGPLGASATPDLEHKGLLFTYKMTPVFNGDAADIVTVPDDTSPYDASGNNGGLETNGYVAVHALDALDYDLPTAGGGRLDGNLPENRHLHSATVATSWAANDYLILRWFENDDAGNELGIGIDDLSFSAGAVPEPVGTMLLSAITAFAMLTQSRRLRQG